MFKVIYIAPNAKFADKIMRSLAAEGLMATRRSLQGGDSGGGPVEILVPQSEVAEAHEILSHLLCCQATRFSGAQKRKDS
ncbi:MAG: glutamate decarboxylase [Bacillota bacterium]|jgi:hypothetical protein